jgi:hypothetical protein
MSKPLLQLRSNRSYPDQTTPKSLGQRLIKKVPPFLALIKKCHLLRVGGGGLILAPGEEAQEGLAVVLPQHVNPGRVSGGAGGYGEQRRRRRI